MTDACMHKSAPTVAVCRHTGNVTSNVRDRSVLRGHRSLCRGYGMVSRGVALQHGCLASMMQCSTQHPQRRAGVPQHCQTATHRCSCSCFMPCSAALTRPSGPGLPQPWCKVCPSIWPHPSEGSRGAKRKKCVSMQAKAITNSADVRRVSTELITAHASGLLMVWRDGAVHPFICSKKWRLITMNRPLS